MGFLKGKPERSVVHNRKRFYRSLGVRPEEVVRCGQAHGRRVHAVSKIPASGYFLKTDALITDKLDTFLTVITADCFPVFFYSLSPKFNEAKQRGRITRRSLAKGGAKEGIPYAIGIAHAGWRGVVKEIVPETLRCMKKKYGIQERDARVVIGPGIRKCHFGVGNEVLQKFKQYKKFMARKNKKFFVDLPGIIQAQLIRAGVTRKNITDTNECTYHNPKKYFSYRRDRNEQRPKGFGNNISIIGYRKNS
ncbi:MAG: laccase domain-containing protein [Candidatus Sungbacteria bacterium]|nr:laccase domain-containing protein [Candidatus Sungbacteria bacterium]